MYQNIAFNVYIHVFVIETIIILTGLPLCVDTEDTTQIPVRAPIYPTSMNPTEQDHSLTSSADIIVSTYVLTYISLSLQF